MEEGGGNQNFKIVLILTKKKIGSKNGYSLSRNIPCLVPFIPEMCWWGEGRGGDALKIPLFNFHVDLSQCHLSSLSRPPGKIQKIFTLLIYSFYRLISPLWPLPLSDPPPFFYFQILFILISCPPPPPDPKIFQ